MDGTFSEVEISNNVRLIDIYYSTQNIQVIINQCTDLLQMNKHDSNIDENVKTELMKTGPLPLVGRAGNWQCVSVTSNVIDGWHQANRLDSTSTISTHLQQSVVSLAVSGFLIRRTGQQNRCHLGPALRPEYQALT